MPSIDLIIPAKNEQPNIPALFEAIPPGLFRHVIVADNGSTDRTAELARARGAVVVHEPEPGYGAACLAGLKWLEQQDKHEHDQSHGPRNMSEAEADPADVHGIDSRGDSGDTSGEIPGVAFLDADLADDPGKLPELCRPIIDNQADLVIGTRTNMAEPGALDPHQRFGNWLACRLIGLAAGRRYRDLGPMRVVTRNALTKLDMRDLTWGWTVEMQFKAARLGLRVIEIDVPYRKRHLGKSKISGSLIGSFKAGTKIIGTIATLWWQSRKH